MEPIASEGKICFCPVAEKYFASGNNPSCVANSEIYGKHVRATNVFGNIFPCFSQSLKALQNEKTCCQKHLLPTHIFPMFTSFATRDYVSAVMKKHILLLETMLPVHVAKLGKLWGNVSGNMFPRFARA